MKRLIIGDIHGCYRELQDLLEKAGIGADDEIIALGDIVDRGPEPLKVLNFFREQKNARTIMGNHERKHFRSARNEIKPALSQKIAKLQIGIEEYPAACQFMESLAHFIDLPEAILVHAFFEPSVPLEQQRTNVIVGTMSGQSYLEKKYQRPWYELYDQDKPIIVGHMNYLYNGQPLIYNDKVFAIDTGCYAKGSLTGVILPDFKVISVPSRRNYWQEVSNHYRALRLLDLAIEEICWEDIHEIEQLKDSMPQERFHEIQNVYNKAQQLLPKLIDHIESQNKKILIDLEQHHKFSQYSPRKQGTLYANYIKKNPCANLLQRARKGELSRESVCKHFKKPMALIQFVAAIKDWS